MMPAGRSGHQLSRARLTPRQVAAVMVTLCRAVEGEGLSTLRPLRAGDLDVGADGDLILATRTTATRRPAVDVLVALLDELTAQLQPDARGASLLRIAAVRTNGLPAFREVSQLRAWAEQTFDVDDPAPILKTIGWPAALAPAAPDGARATRRLAVAMVVLALGIVAHVWQGRVQERTPDRAGAAPPVPPRARHEAYPSARTSARPDGGAQAHSPVPSEGPSAAATAAEQSPPQAQASLRVDVPDVEGPVFSPSFGDDGTTMFFHTREGAGTRLVEAAVGDDDELLGLSILSDDRARNYHLRLAPDGGRVAFDSDRDGERAVYLANRDGTGVRKVSGAGYAAVPSWSPDGSKLAFVRAEKGRPRVWNLWLAELETGELRRLTGHRVGQTWGASWFPDGARIAYSHETALRILDLASGTVRQFASPRRGRLLRTPAVSPDGRRVVFQVHGDGAWLLSVDNGAMRRILDDASAEEFTWHPSGGRFAYHSRRDGQWRIWITALPDAPAP